ncbi:MAG: wax ester/triacylglycerol synthase family O-acyltransferase [Acidimicrobiales bacterium]|nr:wax ester/triacylglycerol synthase family O-acyltransferase [Acidimicrobiales bacterium]
MPPTTAERLNPTDATLWEIERDPTLRTTIVAVLRLRQTADVRELVGTLDRATRTVPRLRQRIVDRPGGVGAPVWAAAPNFALADHVRLVAAPADLDRAVVAIAEHFASTEFDRSKPLWECAYVDAGRGPSAVVLKVHHALTDGVGGIELLDAIFDASNVIPLDTTPDLGEGDWLRLALEDIVGVARQAAKAPFQVSGLLASAALHPARAVTGTVRAASSLGRLLLPNSGPESELFAGRSEARTIAMHELDLEQLHAAAKRQECTVNHAFFAGVVGGVAEYHRAAGRDLRELRVVMPVSLRRPDDPAGGNRWAPARFVVPADITDPGERMAAMRDLVLASRREPSLSLSRPLAGAMQALPSRLSSGLVGSMMQGVDVVLTNVPGPTERQYLAGAEVDGLWAFAPTAGAAVNTSLVSHGPRACIGLLADAAAVSEPAALNEMISAELQEVTKAALRRAPRELASVEPAEPASERPARLSALDTGFLRLESPDTPMHVGGLAILDGDVLRLPDGRLRRADIQQHIEARLQQLPGFLQKLAEVPLGLGRPVWIDDPAFDIERHVRFAALSNGSDRAELLDFAARTLAEPLERTHPLWEIWLVDGLENGGVGFIEKVHHCLVDGVSGVELAVALFDIEPDTAADTPAPTTPAASPSAVQRMTDAVVEQIADPFTTARALATSAVLAPKQIAAQISAVAGAARELANPSTLTRRASFNRTVGRRRELRTAVLKLDQIRSVGAEANASVNDVILAVLAGGLRTWMSAHHEELFDVHAMVPVSLRTKGVAEEPGNQVGGMLVELPVSEPDRRRRLATVCRRTRRVKAAHEGEGLGVVLHSLDHVPSPWISLGARMVAEQRMANLVVTNMRGPESRLYFLGATINEIIPIVPLAPHLGLGVAILSYVGGVTISLSGDPEVCADLDALAESLIAELQLLEQEISP